MGGEILELVDVEEEVSAFVLGAIGPTHGGELKLGDQKGAEEVRFVVTHAALAEVGDEDAGVVHDEWDGDAVAHLAEEIADDGRMEQGTDFVQDGGNGTSYPGTGEGGWPEQDGTGGGKLNDGRRRLPQSLVACVTEEQRMEESAAQLVRLESRFH